MSNPGRALVAIALTGVAGFMLKALRHVDDGRALIGPTARAIAEEARSPEFTIAQVAATGGGEKSDR